MAACLGVILSDAALVRAESPTKAFGPMLMVSDIVAHCTLPACDVEVAPAPLPGRTRAVSRMEVREAVIRAGFDTEGLRIPEMRRVVRPSRMVGDSVLREKITRAVEAILPEGVTLEALGRVSRVEVPAKGFTLEARWPGADTFRHRVSIPVDLLADGMRFRTIQVAATVAIKARLPVAARALARGAVLAARDIAWAEVSLNTLPTHIAKQESEIVGRQLEAGIKEGMPFESRQLSRVPIVNRGQHLTVTSVRGLIHVETMGEAKQEGAIGERISVLLLPVGRMVWAEIRGPDMAMVVP